MQHRLLVAGTRAAIRYASVPIILFGANGIAIATLLSAAPPTHIARDILLLMLGALAFTFAAERILPYAPEWNQNTGDFGRDLLHFSINESISIIPLLVVPIFIATAPDTPSSIWPRTWPLALELLLALLIFDLGQTLFHGLAHLWRLHSIHHEVRRMYGLNGILKHPLYQILASIVSTLPLVLMGMPKRFSLVLAFMSFTQLLLQHTNVDHRLGPLRHVFATAQVHRFHHLRGPAGNVNFALFFSFFDRLLGTAAYEARTLTSRDIGLDEIGGVSSWWQQMRAPFRQRFARSRRKQ